MSATNTTTGWGDEVTATPYGPGDGLPLFLEPAGDRLRTSPDEVQAWLSAVPFEQLLAEAGAVVLRGFPIRTTDDFMLVTKHLPPLDLGYAGGNAPREAVKGSVMESTRADSSVLLYLHQEMAYLPQFPNKLAFWCHVPSETGGETIIADMRRLQQRIPQHVFEKVRDLGVRYVRNFRSPERPTGGKVLDDFHPTWLQSFKTDDRDEINAICESRGVQYEWQPDDSITMITDLPGVREHPVTGEKVWMNQLHTMAMRPPVISQVLHDAMNVLYGNTDFTRAYRVRYGDDSPVPDDDLDAIYEAYDELTVGFPWQEGDVMFVDNYMTAHGRNPFTGDRDIQVQLFS